MKKKLSLLTIGFFIASLVMMILIISLQVRIDKLEEEKAVLERAVQDHRLTVEEMEYDLDLSMEEYIEKYARGVLGYHKYSDIIIKEATDE